MRMQHEKEERRRVRHLSSFHCNTYPWHNGYDRD
jgi:hypothetical protein